MPITLSVEITTQLINVLGVLGGTVIGAMMGYYLQKVNIKNETRSRIRLESGYEIYKILIDINDVLLQFSMTLYHMKNADKNNKNYLKDIYAPTNICRKAYSKLLESARQIIPFYSDIIGLNESAYYELLQRGYKAIINLEYVTDPNSYETGIKSIKDISKELDKALSEIKGLVFTDMI